MIETDKKYGRLLPIHLCGVRSRKSWLCVCDCGKEVEVLEYSLLSGNTKSCGCLRKESRTTHGLSKHRLYDSWKAMIRRCYKEDHPNYKLKGIKVCDRWLDVKNFVEDMDSSYFEGAFLDRIDTNLGYYPENCRWVTPLNSCINRSGSKSSNSKYKGVSFKKSTNKWEASITIGSFSSEREAALAYDKVSYFLRKENSYLNFPEKISDPSKDIVPIVLVLNDLYWIPFTLKSIDGRFQRIIIYDAGSTDGTLDVLRWFEKNSDSEVLLEELPLIPPKGQIAYRNAPISELGESKYYLLVDGDEVWPEESLDKLFKNFYKFVVSGKLYGVVNRIEVRSDLKTAYSLNQWTPHHRLYSKICTWQGKHPGESARIKQKPSNEFKFDEEVSVYHFHNTLRSPLESKVPKRVERKSQKTYHPGKIDCLDIFGKLPMLRERVNKFEINPVLEELQNDLSKMQVWNSD